ncbi:hypothetical protein [Pyramidobacter porci]|uniref:hypothetical protein n=1 Tax=Pyramidobacter porci TaxID=2605789 RepID=UPI002A765969|nr:hypothetical protein [Pyramidobacter porci]
MVNEAAVVKIIDRISCKSENPCKKKLQKIVFLVEMKGIDVGCDYGIHFYGPYSADLDFAVRELSDEGVLKIDYTPTEHRISVRESSFGNDYNDETVNEIVDEFAKETPSRLELIATALYVYLQVHKDPHKITAGVKKIKGNKYPDEEIDAAIERLKSTGYIVAA